MAHIVTVNLFLLDLYKEISELYRNLKEFEILGSIPGWLSKIFYLFLGLLLSGIATAEGLVPIQFK